MDADEPSPHTNRDTSNGKGLATFNNEDDTAEVILQSPAMDKKGRENLCGVLSWRPDCLQRFADMRLLTMVLSIMSLLNGVVFAYYNAVITSIENRFGLSSSMIGFVKNVDGIGYILSIVIVSHFCRYANKPRLFACACLLSAFATGLFGFPHVLYGSGDDITDLDYSEIDNATTSISKDKFTQFCDANSNGTNTDICQKQSSNLLGKFNAGALACFIASEFLQGVSNSPAVSLGITYVDDNMGGKSPKYFGKLFNILISCLFTFFAKTAIDLNDIISHLSLDVCNKSLSTFYRIWPWSLGSVNVCRFEW